MERRWWKAQWSAVPGFYHEYYFFAPDDLELARTRLQLNCFNLGYVLPNEYELWPAIPPKEETQWSYPTLKVSKNACGSGPITLERLRLLATPQGE